MREIQVMIAAAEELHDEKLQFTELIVNLNEALEPRGLRLRRLKWTPGEADDFRQRLGGCEMCLNIYWRQLPPAADDELRTAYEATCAGNNPRHLYIFFKEPSDGISAELADFKAAFETKYGHFFCRFENVDTMNLQFLLQFEATQSRAGERLVTVADGHVSVEGRQFVNLDNVPFAGLNREYRRLQAAVATLEGQLADVRARYKADPDSDALLEELTTVKAKLKEVSDEYNRYQEFLFAKAMEFASCENQKVSERMRRARELFERGEAAEAARLMNWEDIKSDKERNRALYREILDRRKLEVEEFRSSATYAMTDPDKTIPDRFAAACHAYDEAIDTAREIHYDDDKMAEMLFDYAYLLQQFNRMYDAFDCYNDALVICRRLADVNTDAYLPNVATTLNNLAVLQKAMQCYVEAEENYAEALAIRRRLAESNPEAYLPRMADTLNNLAILQYALQHYGEAEVNYSEALATYRRLAGGNPDAYLPDVAMTLNNLAILQRDLQRYGEAERNYGEALATYRRLAEVNPEAYLTYVATTLNNLALLQRALHRYNEAEGNYDEALSVRRRLADANPDAYLTYVATTLNNLAVLQKAMQRYVEAEENYVEALAIRRSLAETNPDAYLPDVATTQNNLAVLQKALQRYGEAEENYGEALATYRRLADANPDAYLPDVAMTLNNLANLQHALQRYGEAEGNYGEALATYCRLAEANPDAYLPYVGQTLWNMASLYNGMDDEDKTIEYLREALPIYKQLEEKNPGLYTDKINTIKEILND